MTLEASYTLIGLHTPIVLYSRTISLVRGFTLFRLRRTRIIQDLFIVWRGAMLLAIWRRLLFANL